MRHEFHLSDHELVLAADNELPPDRAAQVEAHLSMCRLCQARQREIARAGAGVTQLLRGGLAHAPAADGPRAMLKARMGESSSQPPRRSWPDIFAWKWAAVALLFVAGIFIGYRGRTTLPSVPLSFPEPSLTPGAVATVSATQVCESPRPKNRVVPASLQRKVFEEYGIPSAEPRAYEVDYLITPALGGADDIRNLWPQSNSSAMWNARVKDALEDRLRDLVCGGNLDLASAQQDISSDWIAAYKKYFHTDRPIASAPPN